MVELLVSARLFGEHCKTNRIASYTEAAIVGCFCVCVWCNWCHEVGLPCRNRSDVRRRKCVTTAKTFRNFSTRSMKSGSWNVPIFESEKRLINNCWVYVEFQPRRLLQTEQELSFLKSWNRTRKCQTDALKMKYCSWHAMRGRDLFTLTVVKLTRVLEIFQFPNFCSLSDQKISRRPKRWMPYIIWWINYFLLALVYSKLKMVN